MLTRYVGTILLGVGFTMLAGAVLLWDPTAPDANIGAGILSVVGLPAGAIGLALIIAHIAYATWERIRGDRIFHEQSHHGEGRHPS
jgi:hypothetical protein